MNVKEIIKETKRLSISNRQTMIIETMKEIKDFEEIEDTIDILKSRNEKKVSWDDAKLVLKNLGKL